MSETLPPPEECANCGATIPRNARSCPECGADERTGWRETSIYDDLDLPESAWEEEVDSKRAPAPRVNGVPWYWWFVGAVLLVLLVTGLIAQSRPDA
jgi:RNA polymerase subunit RPABC4/transcription elongation factor Spt4